MCPSHCAMLYLIILSFRKPLWGHYCYPNSTGSQRLSNLPKVTHVVSKRLGISIFALSTLSCYFIYVRKKEVAERVNLNLLWLSLWTLQLQTPRSLILPYSPCLTHIFTHSHPHRREYINPLMGLNSNHLQHLFFLISLLKINKCLVMPLIE